MTVRNNENKHENHERFPTEKQVEKTMRDMKINPSEKMKRKSLQQALVGIHDARDSHRRKWQMNKLKNWTKGLFGFGVVTAALLITMMNIDDLQDMLNGDPPHTGESEPPVHETPVAPQPDPEDESEPQEDLSESEDPTYPEVDRAQEQDIITYPEGMEQEDTYQLLNEDFLPFTTYIPSDWEAEVIETDTATGVNLAPAEYDYGDMDIVFFHEGATEEEAQAMFTEMADEYRETEVLPREDEAPLAEWVLESLTITDERVGTMTLGYAEDRYFYVRSEYTPVAAEGWGPNEAVIFDEWRWKETDQPLEEQSRLEQHEP